MEMFSQVDFCEATSSEHADQPIVANLLAEKVVLSHHGILSNTQQVLRKG
jgi:hypothetical protein